MRMSASMQLQQKQQQRLSQHQLQSLELLHLPVMELRALIQKELDHNPVLEPTEEAAAEDGEGDEIIGGDEAEKSVAPAAEAENSVSLDAPEDVATEAEDRDYLYQNDGNGEDPSEAEARRQYMFDSLVRSESLSEHLLIQAELADLSGEDMAIVELIVGNLDDAGYLTVPVADIAQNIGTDLPTLERILAVVQGFTPSGIAARDLRECLLIQLRNAQRGESLAARIIEQDIDDLSRHRFAALAQRFNCSEEAVKGAVAEIRRLDPKPGLGVSPDDIAYIVPEVNVVLDAEGKYVARMDTDLVPRVFISRRYRALLDDAASPTETKSYLRSHLRSGKAFIKSLDRRNETIMRIASEIVERQQAFFHKGISALRPLTMTDMATKLGFDESTVSRTVSDKYMRSPQGVIEMRFFFSQGMKTANGAEVSNKVIQDRIVQIIAAEDASAPHSDDDIRERLKAEGFDVARRTVAKYRILQKIPSSNQRKHSSL
ncbi:MAG: RNA polymerase factor sigma-54 [Kiritimatiellaeota bacterium]|nr:RNA polymerase factor sigma-54 [Kiritimatiellota bacterium]